jgi:hypothetical protein
VYEADEVAVHGFDGAQPCVSYRKDGVRTRSTATSSPAATASTACAAPACRRRDPHHEKVYPFGWLGVLADVPPVSHELIYATTSAASRCAACAAHAQPLLRAVPLDDKVEDWSDDALLGRAAPRLPAEAAASLVTGPSIEKSIAPLRSFVAEPMRFGRLFLAGDAAHIVPPTGAKGLNLAASDVRYLSRALHRSIYAGARRSTATRQRALRRVWKAERFSWWMTSLMHRFPENGSSARRCSWPSWTTCSAAGRATALAENYVGNQNLLRGVGTVTVDLLLGAVQQLRQRVLVVDVGRRHHCAVRQAALAVHADVQLHAEVPLLALAGLVHFGIALAAGVLGRAGCRDDRGIDDGARAQLHALVLQHLADLGKQGCSQVMLLQQPSELQQRGAVGHTLTTQVDAHEAAQCSAVEQRLLARLVGQVEPVLHELALVRLLAGAAMPAPLPMPDARPPAAPRPP